MQLCAIRNGFHLSIFVLQFLYLHYVQSNMGSESFFALNRPNTEASCCTILHHNVGVLVSINSLFIT